MQTSEVEIQQEPLGPNAAVRVRGTVNMENSPKLRNVLKKLADGKTPGVIVSFEGAQGVDTSTIFAHPEVNVAFKTGKPGKVLALSYCNIHGLWTGSAELKF